MAINYLQRIQARNQANVPSDFSRGAAAGKSLIGDAMGNIAKAIDTAKKDALANKLMNTQDAPRAALVSPGFASGSAGGGANPSAPQADIPDPDPDPVQTNQPGASINPDFQPEYTFQDMPDNSLNGAAAKAKAASSLSATPAGPTPNVIAPGVSTAGTAPASGGVDEMNLRKEMLAMQVQKQAIASSQAKAADETAEAAGTGRYAMDAAQKRANLLHTQAEIEALKNKPSKEIKNPPAVNIASEPVIDQAQLNRHINGTYGNGVAEGLAQLVSDGSKDATIDPQTLQSSNMVTIPLGANKSAKIPVSEAANFVKQMNALRLKQGQSAYRVPGEDQTTGSSAAIPYPASNNLDVYSRAPGTWVRLPNGKVAQVPARK
jgi:hypothetical protein